MKTSYLLGSLNRGGTETLVLDVFRNAKANGLDAIGIYRKSGVCEQEFYDSGVSMFKVSPSKNIVSYLLKLRKLISNQKATIVHAQQPLDALFAYIALFGTGIKILLTLHGFDYTENKTGKLILRFILKRTSKNIYVSNYQKEYYTKKYKLNIQKQEVVYNGVSFEKFNLNENNANIINDLKTQSDTIILSAVGNFNMGRDQMTLCRFANLLHKANTDFRLLLVGKRIDSLGFRYDECINYCKDKNLTNKVLFLGVRNDVPAILQLSDAFIYSTSHDTFGIAVVEALACGLPVFVNDWSVMTEITENGKLATLYKTKDETDLFRQFSLYLQDKNQFEEKAKAASKIVYEKYSIEKHIQDLKKVYNETK
jgi:glycosyltransferase involved in cell wall biosynthesis